jgi:hypothetical protein
MYEKDFLYFGIKINKIAINSANSINTEKDTVIAKKSNTTSSPNCLLFYDYLFVEN